MNNTNFLDQQASKYKQIFFVSDDDIATMVKAVDVIRHHKEVVLSELYAWLEFTKDMDQYFTEEALDAIADQEDKLWNGFISPAIDAHFVQNQKEAVHALQRLGVPFEGYLSLMVTLQDVVEKLFQRFDLNTFDVMRAYKKLTSIQICIIVDTYNEITNSTILAQNKAMMEMSSPVTRLWDGILFVPLVGILDSHRAQILMQSMLGKIAETEAVSFIMDISGIAVVDTAVANYIIKITKATKLMGCQCIIAGISPAVAQTIVELGIQIDELTTTGNMQDALQQAFNLARVKIGGALV